VGLKVFHTGDVHLDMLYRNRGYPEEVRSKLMEARYQVLEQMVETANRQECHLFVVAGDLFERVTVKEQQVLRAAEILSRFNGVCALLPGNHDYYTPHSNLWESLQKNAAENLVLLVELAPYDLRDYGLEVALYPAPCHSRHATENCVRWISELKEKPGVYWHLGVAHGTLAGYSPDLHHNYFPMSEKELTSAGLHFWFLGHTHVPVPGEDVFYNRHFAYCGTPEPDGFDCRHGGQAWVIELEENGSTRGTAVQPGNYIFKDLEREVNGEEEIEKLVDELAENGEKTLLRLKLRGTMPREEFENRHKILEELKKKVLYLELDDTDLQVEITRETIGELFPHQSFPYLLLDSLAQKGDQRALQVAYSLIKEVKK